MAAKKNTKTTKSAASKKVTPAKKVVARTAVRNSPVPRKTPAAKPAKTVVRNSPIPKPVAAPKTAAAPKQLTWEMISEQAYYIWQREGGSDYDNWVRAERELRGK